MLVDSTTQFPAFTDDEVLTIDVETSCGDPITKETNSFDGVSFTIGYAITQTAPCPSCGGDGKYKWKDQGLGEVVNRHVETPCPACEGFGNRSWYFPLRHHSGVVGENLPVPEAVAYLKSVIESGRTIINHNIKFDFRFWLASDGIEAKGDIVDTQVLARLVECDLLNYSLQHLVTRFFGKAYSAGSGEGKESGTIRNYLKSLPRINGKEQKSYGQVSASVMASYACKDSLWTWRLYKKLLAKLPEVTRTRPDHPEIKYDLWTREIKLTKWMVKWEIEGVPVNRRAIKETHASCIRKMLTLMNELLELSDGMECDPDKDEEITALLCGKFGVVPKAYTPKSGKPQWNGMALRTLSGDEKVKRIGILLADFRNESHFAGQFCKGWLQRIGIDERMHCDFRVAGTATGRLSCQDPNLMNVPPRAENFVECEDDWIIVGWDYSQIEYRIFGHYTGDPFIVSSYRENPKADFHQLLADKLGVDRQFAKQLNFSFLYGMGKEKLLRNLAGILTLKADQSDEMREKMRLMAYGAGTSISQRAKQLSVTDESKELANGIYNEYHKQFPSIRQFQRRCTTAVRARGWLRNYFGRVYALDDRGIHKAVNYIIQGTAADLFKDRLLALFEWADDLQHMRLMYKMFTNVYDSCYFIVHKSVALEFYENGTQILEGDLGFRVPIKVEGKVSTKTWGTVEKVKDDGFVAAVDRSREAMTRLAGLARNEWEKDGAKTSGRYDFSGTGN